MKWIIDLWYKAFPRDYFGPGDFFLYGIATGMFLMQLLIFWPLWT